MALETSVVLALKEVTYLAFLKHLSMGLALFTEAKWVKHNRLVELLMLEQTPPTCTCSLSEVVLLTTQRSRSKLQLEQRCYQCLILDKAILNTNKDKSHQG